MPDRRLNLKYDLVLPRVQEIREYSLFVIAIEGEKTEKIYFQKFGAPRVKVDILPTLPGNSAEPEGIIDRLRTYVSKNDIKDEDQCWLVFDVDHRPDDNLQEVCRHAADEHFKVAISNPCFEFWLFLHKFEVSDLDRTLFEVAPEKRSQEMKKRLPQYNYHGLPFSEFRDDVKRAVGRALRNDHAKGIPRFPGTTVYRLVKSLPIKT